MGKRESGIQTRTVNLLVKTYTRLVVRVKHGTVFAIVGDPDLYGCVEGHFFALEIKNESGQLTKIQERRLWEWAQAGAIVGALREPEDAVRFINEALIK